MYPNYTTHLSDSPDNSLLQQLSRRLDLLERRATRNFNDPNKGTSYGSTYNSHDHTYHMDPPQFDHMPHYPSYELPNHYQNACPQEPPINFSSSQFMSPSGQPIYNPIDNVNSFDPPYESTYYGTTQQNYMEPTFNFPNGSNDTWGTYSSHNCPPSYLETNPYEIDGPPSVNPVSHQSALPSYTPDQDEMDWILSLPLPKCISSPSRINESCEPVTPDVLSLDDPSFSSSNHYDQTSLASKLQVLVRAQAQNMSHDLYQSDLPSYSCNNSATELDQMNQNILIQRMEETNIQISESSARMTQLFNRIQESLNHTPIPSSFDDSLNDDTYRDSVHDNLYISNSLPFDLEQSNHQWNTYDHHEISQSHNSSLAPIFSSPIMLPNNTDQLSYSHDIDHIHYNESEEVITKPHDVSYLPPLMEYVYSDDELYQDDSFIPSHYSNNLNSFEIDNHEDKLIEDEDNLIEDEDEFPLELSNDNLESHPMIDHNHTFSIEPNTDQLGLVSINMGPEFLYYNPIPQLDSYLSRDPFLRDMSLTHSELCLTGESNLADARLLRYAQLNSILMDRAAKNETLKFFPVGYTIFNTVGTWPNKLYSFIVTSYIYIPPLGDFPIFLLLYDLYCTYTK